MAQNVIVVQLVNATSISVLMVKASKKKMIERSLLNNPKTKIKIQNPKCKDLAAIGEMLRFSGVRGNIILDRM